MQERLPRSMPPAYSPDGSHLKVDAATGIACSADLLQCAAARIRADHEGGLLFRFLNRGSAGGPGRPLPQAVGGSRRWDKADDPLLELATVLYLINVKDVYPLGRDIVGPQDLKEGHFFQGPHELKIAPLLERFGSDAAGLRASRPKRLGGEPVDMADAAYRLKPFPRVHLYYLLWEGDEEFPPRMLRPFRALDRRDPGGRRHLGPGQPGVHGAADRARV
ncbi:MAG: DUF3786 domain-containing protein [Desulfobacterales bacterium]|nr:DUF3786 domain-containing protein [Desulfobacterales bacterium]